MCKANRHTCVLHRRQCDSGVWVLQPETRAEIERQQHDRERGRRGGCRDPLLCPLYPPPLLLLPLGRHNSCSRQRAPALNGGTVAVVRGALQRCEWCVPVEAGRRGAAAAAWTLSFIIAQLKRHPPACPVCTQPRPL